MNDKIYNLAIRLIDAKDIGGRVKEEILAYLILPKHQLERGLTPDEPMTSKEVPAKLFSMGDDEVGTVRRPDDHDIERRTNKKLADEEDAVEETLG